MKLIDRQYLDTPFYGRRPMTAELNKKGYAVNSKRVGRLMRKMGIECLWPKPRREAINRIYGKFPYLLRNTKIVSQNHVWGTDITYVPVDGGYVYLTAVLDLYSRFVLSWRLSNSLESRFCVEAIEKALELGKPRIINSDQGTQYTSRDYIETVQSRGIEISMSGRGRCWDNIFVERFWRSLKYEEVYLNQYSCVEEAAEGIESYIGLYNTRRLHSALNYRTPSQVYWE